MLLQNIKKGGAGLQGANMPTIVNFSSVQCSLCIRVVVESPSYCNIIYRPMALLFLGFWLWVTNY